MSDPTKDEEEILDYDEADLVASPREQESNEEGKSGEDAFLKSPSPESALTSEQQQQITADLAARNNDMEKEIEEMERKLAQQEELEKAQKKSKKLEARKAELLKKLEKKPDKKPKTDSYFEKGKTKLTQAQMFNQGNQWANIMNIRLTSPL